MKFYVYEHNDLLNHGMTIQGDYKYYCGEWNWNDQMGCLLEVE